MNEDALFCVDAAFAMADAAVHHGRESEALYIQLRKMKTVRPLGAISEGSAGG
jgi:hypothetical protein